MLSDKGDVAVKVYHSDQATFDNEYEILNLLQPLKHPNIIQLVSMFFSISSSSACAIMLRLKGSLLAIVDFGSN